jgi:hypothetical protein
MKSLLLLLPLLAWGQITPLGAVTGATGVSGPTPTAKTCAAVSGGIGTTQSCTWSANPAIGETIYCYVFSFSTPMVFSVTDSAANVYLQNGATLVNANSTDTAMFYFPLLTGSISTTTLNVVAGGNFLSLMCMSATSTSGALTVDGAIGTGQIGSGTSNSATTSPTGPHSLNFCGGSNATGATLVLDAAYTASATSAGNLKSMYRVLASAGMTTATITTGASSSQSMICAAYK